jgi:hypothetical protein
MYADEDGKPMLDASCRAIALCRIDRDVIDLSRPTAWLESAPIRAIRGKEMN